MAYTKFYALAHDDDPATPATAAWANHLEDGIFDAAGDADAAAAAAAAAAASAAAAQASATALASRIGAETLIAEQILATTPTVVTFSAIPQTFTHLRILAELTANNAADQTLTFQCNGDTGANYGWQLLFGQNAAASASSLLPASSIHMGVAPAAGGFGWIDAMVYFYATTSRHKGVRSQWGALGGVAPFAGFTNGRHLANAAITSIDLALGGNQFAVGSRIQLYGRY